MFRKQRSTGSGTSHSAGAASGQVLLRARSSVASDHSDAVNGTGGGGGRDHVHHPALIQRLIILHDGLMPSPPSKTQPRSQRRRNPQLSEDASLAEHGEFILYYYDHSLRFEQDRGTPARPFRRRSSADSQESLGSLGSLGSRGSVTRAAERPPADHATEEAVRFAGLCRALRSLPLALRGERHDGEDEGYDEDELAETDVVHLRDSTLVFVPLELDGTIVAVAQIPRAENPQKAAQRKSGHPQSQRASAGFGADPSAMREAIRRIHAAFSLLCGGGIHRRLLRTKKAEGSDRWVVQVANSDEDCDSSGSKLTKMESINDEDEDDSSEEGDTSGLSTNGTSLPRKDNLVWEVAEQVESKLEIKDRKGPRVKSRRTLKKLSSSFNSGDGSSRNSGDAKTDDGPSPGDYRYGGMKELFDLRREHRKLSNELREDQATPSRGPRATVPNRCVRFGGLAAKTKSRRWASAACAEDLFNDIANDYGQDDCQARIDDLLRVLPITSLRDDLVTHYDGWLGQMQGVCEIMQGGLGRCVVDMVPPPLVVRGRAQPVRGQYPPLSPTPFVCLAAGAFMKSLMQEEVPKLKDKLKGLKVRLLGMSLFYQNRLVLSEVSPSHANGRGTDVMLPPETAHMIAEHFHCRERRQIKAKTTTKHDTVHHGQDAEHRPSLNRWISGLSMAAIKDEIGDDGNDKNTAYGVASSGFAAPPPSLDSARKEESLFVRNINKHAWLPRVHLPCASGEGTDDETETHAALFDGKELSFILIFELPSSGGGESALTQMAEELKPRSRKRDGGSDKPISDETKAFADMLTLLADQLWDFCNTYSSREAEAGSKDRVPVREINSNSVFPGELGMDIIFIDRDESSFVLLSHHDLSSNDFKRIAPKNDASANGSKPKFGLFGMGHKPKETGDERVPCQSLRYSNMLDCRHKLAAYLPLDVMLAFDDMFNEMGCLSCRRNVLTPDATDSNGNNETCTKKSIELCTFLPQGWVYGRAYGNLELYVLLDTARFVTINDVQKAVTRVRERIFNDKIR